MLDDRCDRLVRVRLARHGESDVVGRAENAVARLEHLVAPAQVGREAIDLPKRHPGTGSGHDGHDRHQQKRAVRGRQNGIENGVAERLDGTDEDYGGGDDKPAAAAVHRRLQPDGHSGHRRLPTRSRGNMRLRLPLEPESAGLS